MSAQPLKNQQGQLITVATLDRELSDLDVPDNERKAHLDRFKYDPKAYMAGIADGSIKPVSIFGKIFQAFIAAVGNQGDSVPDIGHDKRNVERDIPPPETGATPDVLESATQSSGGLNEALVAMVAGSEDKSVIATFERESEKLIRQGMASGTISKRNGKAAIKVIETDGVISNEQTQTGISFLGQQVEKNEYEIYQAILEGAIRQGAISAGDLKLPNGASFDGNINNTVELGVVMTEMARVREESATSRG